MLIGMAAIPVTLRVCINYCIANSTVTSEVLVNLVCPCSSMIIYNKGVYTDVDCGGVSVSVSFIGQNFLDLGFVQNCGIWRGCGWLICNRRTDLLVRYCYVELKLKLQMV